jgi:DnaJ-class molecular chaperone
VKLHAAYLTLGLRAGDADAAAIRRAFALAVAKAHPDQGGDGSDIGKIKLARDVLLKHLEDLAAVTKCSVCEGEGRVKTPRGPKRDCPACGGSGETRKR